MIKQMMHAFVMCQSMFCAIPLPRKLAMVWDENARPWMLLFLPVIGLEMGAIWFLLSWICGYYEIPQLLRGLVLCGYAYLVTGFIHLDGFMDVKDAVGSCRDLEKRRAILKDSHVGSFAVIGCVFLLLTSFACLASLDDHFEMLIFIPVISRCCSSLAVTMLRPISVSQYAGAFKEGVKKIQPVLLALMLAVAATLAVVVCGKYALALVGELLVYGWALRKGFHSLDGMNGDISGYALSLAEAAALAVLAVLPCLI